MKHLFLSIFILFAFAELAESQCVEYFKANWKVPQDVPSIFDGEMGEPFVEKNMACSMMCTKKRNVFLLSIIGIRIDADSTLWLTISERVLAMEWQLIYTSR
uniref:CW domain-containing protein n=1 Tax=Caenorhabditis tropicalis TaxID=1561998 RepID=A0A1I7UW23_9PELO